MRGHARMQASPPPTMMVNMALMRSTRSLRLLTVLVAFLLIFNMASFWAVYFWPAVTTIVGLYFCYLVWRTVRRNVEYEVPQWVQLGLFILMFLGILQLAVGIILVTIEEDVGDARRVFQYVSLITGPLISLTVFLWRTSILRVFAGTAAAVQGRTDLNPRMHVGLSPREEIDRYLQRNPTFGESIHSDRNKPIAGYVHHNPYDDEDGGDYMVAPDQHYAYDYNYANVNYDNSNRSTNKDGRQRNGAFNSPPAAVDFYGYETDPKTGRQVLVTHGSSVNSPRGPVGSPTFAFGTSPRGPPNANRAFAPDDYATLSSEAGGRGRGGAGGGEYAYGSYTYNTTPRNPAPLLNSTPGMTTAPTAVNPILKAHYNGNGYGTGWGAKRESIETDDRRFRGSAESTRYSTYPFSQQKNMPSAFAPRVGGSQASVNTYSPERDPFTIGGGVTILTTTEIDHLNLRNSAQQTPLRSQQSAQQVPSILRGANGSSAPHNPQVPNRYVADQNGGVVGAPLGSPSPRFPQGYVGARGSVATVGGNGGSNSRPATPTNSQGRRVTFAPYGK